MDTAFHIFFVIIGVLIALHLLALAGLKLLELFLPPKSEPEEEDPWIERHRNTTPEPIPQPIPEPIPEPIPQPTGYTKDWATVSRRHKELSRWTCQDCRVCLKSDQNLLHVHHRDRNPQNNSFYNLEALCVICHSERPGAGHRRLAGAISNDGRRWRVEQHRRRRFNWGDNA